MNASPSLGNLAKALAAAQRAMQPAARDSDNDYFHSRYADLASVWTACREALGKHGLAVLQPVSAQGATVTVTTLLLSPEGEFVSESLTVTAKDASPQAVGSAITYARRYGLAAMVGVAPDDDDAEAAQGRAVHHATPRPASNGTARPHSPAQKPKSEPAEAQPEPAKQGLEEAFPTQPPVPGPMFLNLQRKDSDLAAQKLCKPGELIAHLRAAAEEAGHVEVELWSGPVMRRFAKEQVERFETGARRERAAKQKTQTATQPNGQATSDKAISGAQVSILASTCAEKGTHFREVAKMLGLNPETDIATLTPGLWQRAMDVALKLDERKESPPPKEEGQEAEDDERHVRTEDEVPI